MMEFKKFKQKYNTKMALLDFLGQLKMINLVLNEDGLEVRKMMEELKNFGNCDGYDAKIFKCENYCTYTFYRNGIFAKKYAVICDSNGRMYDIISLYNSFDQEQTCVLKHISYLYSRELNITTSTVSLSDISLDVQDCILTSLSINEKDERLVC